MFLRPTSFLCLLSVSLFLIANVNTAPNPHPDDPQRSDIPPTADDIPSKQASVDDVAPPIIPKAGGETGGGPPASSETTKGKEPPVGSETTKGKDPPVSSEATKGKESPAPTGANKLISTTAKSPKLFSKPPGEKPLLGDKKRPTRDKKFSKGSVEDQVKKCKERKEKMKERLKLSLEKLTNELKIPVSSWNDNQKNVWEAKKEARINRMTACDQIEKDTCEKNFEAVIGKMSKLVPERREEVRIAWKKLRKAQRTQLRGLKGDKSMKWGRKDKSGQKDKSGREGKSERKDKSSWTGLSAEEKKKKIEGWRALSAEEKKKKIEEMKAGSAQTQKKGPGADQKKLTPPDQDKKPTPDQDKKPTPYQDKKPEAEKTSTPDTTVPNNTPSKETTENEDKDLDP